MNANKYIIHVIFKLKEVNITYNHTTIDIFDSQSFFLCKPKAWHINRCSVLYSIFTPFFFTHMLVLEKIAQAFLSIIKN